MWRKHALLLLLCLPFAATLMAQTSTFVIRGRKLKGTEEFSTVKTADGWRQNGRVHLDAGPAALGLSHEAVLSADRELVRYKVEVTHEGQTQVVETKRDGDKLQMTTGGQTRTLDYRPGLIVLDNNITAHYQMLLDRLPKGLAGQDLDILIPQRMALVKGKLRAAGEEPATLDGKPVMVRQYTLDIGSTHVEIGALAESNELVSVAVPLLSVEFLRAGFAPAPRATPERPSACMERELKFRSGEIEVPGTFCLPKNASGRVPVVVFVHGSGANDRDETIGPNKPFRDLAQGLAEAGIGSLRYDKRTFFMAAQASTNKFTVEEEVIADAVAALTYAGSLPQADAKQVFMLGHSLGASLAPFIVARVPETRGVILLAGSPRPLDEMVLEQVAFQSRAAGQDEATVASQVEKLKKSFVGIRSGETPDNEKFMNASVHYWRDLLRRDVSKAWKETKVPVLVLQGGQDIQVRRTDYDLLVAALGPRCKSYFLSALNHLFMSVDGKPTGAEYGSPGHVDSQVIQIIAEWIKGQSARAA